jgi:hypothetical protein
MYLKFRNFWDVTFNSHLRIQSTTVCTALDALGYRTGVDLIEISKDSFDYIARPTEFVKHPQDGCSMSRKEALRGMSTEGNSDKKKKVTGSP